MTFPMPPAPAGSPQQAMMAQYTYLYGLAERLNLAQEQIEAMVLQMAQTEKVTEKMKAENQMLWIQRMNNIRQSAEETVLNDLIYA